MISRPELRRLARQQLGGNIFATPWLCLLFVFFFGSIIVSAGSFIPVLGSLLLLGPISYGMTKITLDLVRGKNGGKINFGDLLAGFTDDFFNTFLLGLLQSLFIFLWSLLFFIPGIVKSYSYAMAFYIQRDSDNKDWNACLTASRKMMNGYKMELFLLDLSFIGWYIVGAICCCGIGTLWVIPYHEAARANFYEQIRGASAQSYEDPLSFMK